MISQSSKTLESMSQAIWYNRWTLEKFARYIKGDILEIGCGIGNFSKNLTKYGQLTAIDINKDYIKKAKKEVEGRAEIGFGDIEKGEYFFSRKVFNTIICINVLEHVNDDTKALKNVYELLAPGGFLILLVPTHSFLFNSIDGAIGHYRRYEREGLEKRLKGIGFEISKIRNLNFVGSIGWYISGHLFKAREVSQNKIKIFNSISPIALFLEDIFEPPFGTSMLVIARKEE